MTRQVEPIYLGDGVYAIFDGYVVELRANDPVNPTDRMFLDDNTLSEFLRYIKLFVKK